MSTQVNKQRHVKVTILNGTSITEGVDLGGGEIVGIITPAAWTPAALSFEAALEPKGATSDDTYGSGTYYPVFPDDSTTQLQVATTQIALATSINVRSTLLNKLKGLQHLKLRSGTTGTPVSQGADRVFYVIIQPQP